MTLIGTEHPEPHACHDDIHLPNVYNPGFDATFCACGHLAWRGNCGVWRSRALSVTTGHTIGGNPITEIRAWDRYFLHRADCDQDGPHAEEDHQCGGSDAVSAQEARGVSTQALDDGEDTDFPDLDLFGAPV